MSGRISGSTLYFAAGCAGVLAAVALATQFVGNEYAFFAAFVVLQFVALATAWNVLGGYAGYVNFGSGAFLARSSRAPRSQDCSASQSGR